MSDFITSEITGLREVQENLAKLGGKIQHSVLRKALQAGADVLGKAVQANTPTKTGLLKSSVGTAVSISDRQQGGVAVVGFGNQGFIARMVEFGHDIKPKGSKKVGRAKRDQVQAIGHAPAHPFMRPAFDASKDEATDVFAETFKNEFEAQKP